MSSSTTTTANNKKKSNSCHKCGKRVPQDVPKLKDCARCMVIGYCSGDCQKADWKTHKKDCKTLAKKQNDMMKRIQKISDEVNEKNPDMAEMLRQMSITQGQDPNFDPFQDETRLFRANGLSAMMVDREECKKIFEQSKSTDQKKEAKRILQALERNLDRPFLQVEAFLIMNEEKRIVWDAIFEQNEELTDLFYKILEEIIKNDIKILKNLPPNATEQDLAAKPPSMYIITRIPYGEAITVGRSGRGALFHKDRAIRYYQSPCWPLSLKLGLAIWNVFKKPNFLDDSQLGRFEGLYQDFWHHQLNILVQSECRELFRSIFQHPSNNENGAKLFFDSSSNTMSSLLQLMSIQGETRRLEKFKPSIYALVAFLVLNAEKYNMANTNLMVANLGRSNNGGGSCLSVQHRDFFEEVAVPFIFNMLRVRRIDEAEYAEAFDSFLNNNPTLKQKL